MLKMIDHAHQWKQLLRENSEIQGGALITTDGVFISGINFGEDENPIFSSTSFIAIADQLSHATVNSEAEYVVFEGEHGSIILIPITSTAFVAVLARSYSKVGLIMLEIRRTFGPGLAGELILPPPPPKSDIARARPDYEAS